MSKQSKDRPKTFPTSSTPKESSPKPPTERSKFQLQIWSVVLATLVGLLSVIVSYMGLSHKVENVQTKVNEVGNRVETVEQNVKAGRLIIISPTDRAVENSPVIVQGKSPYPNRNLYIIVTPVQTNGDWVQKDTIRPDEVGAWHGSAELGNQGTTGDFLIRVMATTATLQPGQLRALPPDAVFSDSITVTRK
jgi:hypothetical protein